MLFLAAIGFGLGGLVDESTGDVGGVPYDEFVAPGCSPRQRSKLGAVRVDLGRRRARSGATYHAMVATPVRPADVYAGVVVWTTSGRRSAIDLPDRRRGPRRRAPPWGVLAIPADRVTATAFSRR